MPARSRRVRRYLRTSEACVCFCTSQTFYKVLLHGLVMSDLDVYDAISLTLRANNNALSNRTTLQKLIYFETLQLDQLKTIMYRNYFYGPFSYQVASALDDMVAFSYLNERVYSKYNLESYHYELTEFGKNYADNAEKKFPAQSKTISRIVEICNKHCELRAKPLSYSAKSHYVLVNGDKEVYTIEDVQRTAREFEWEISGDDAKNGLGLLEDLGLVRRT